MTAPIALSELYVSHANVSAGALLATGPGYGWCRRSEDIAGSVRCRDAREEKQAVTEKITMIRLHGAAHELVDDIMTMGSYQTIEELFGAPLTPNYFCNRAA
jgi:hypothetical protein